MRLSRESAMALTTNVNNCRHLLFGRRAPQKVSERLAILRRSDPLLRHFGSWRVGAWAEFEQLRHRLRRPHDVHALERLGKAIAGERSDPASIQSGKGWAGPRYLLL